MAHDRKFWMLESWANRRNNVRLVAEVVCDRQGKISRSKVVVMFKTPKSYESVASFVKISKLFSSKLLFYLK